MRENNRVYATLVIWFTFAVMTLGLFTIPTSVFNDASSGILLGVLIVLAIAATTGTMAAWGALSDSPTLEMHHAESAAKNKRALRGRVERLVDDLEDDEIYELEALLLERDADSQHHQHR